MDKVKIFIGSSTEGLDVAYAIQQNLEHDAEVTIWTQGIFQLSMPIITSLINQLTIFDYAIFVFSPDDILKLRGAEFTTIRDNVIFETGLFAGKLGIERVYYIKPRGQQDLRLPTDLLGVVAGEYEVRSDKNFIAATGVFSNQVRQNIRRLGKFNHPTPDIAKPEENYENDLAILFTYLEDKGWTTMSFDKIKANVHPKLTEEYLMKLMDIYPKAIRRTKISEGVWGIKWLSNKHVDKNRFVCHGTKYGFPNRNQFWDNFLILANKRFILFGKTNYNWVSKSRDQSVRLGNSIITILENDGIVKILSDDRQETIDNHKAFIEKYILEKIRSSTKKDMLIKKFNENFSYKTKNDLNFTAVVSDDRLVILPRLNNEKNQDKCMVLEVNPTMEDVYINYSTDIENVFDLAQEIKFEI